MPFDYPIAPKANGGFSSSHGHEPSMAYTLLIVLIVVSMVLLYHVSCACKKMMEEAEPAKKVQFISSS